MKFCFVVLTAGERVAITTACGHRLQTTACPTPTVTSATAQMWKEELALRKQVTTLPTGQ